MPQIQQFNPAQAFTQGRQNALSLQKQEQSIARERAEAPIRNQLSRLKLESAQKGVERGDQQYDQQQQQQRAKTMNQVARAMLSIREDQWGSASELLNKQLENSGLPPLIPENLSKDKFNEIIAATQGFMDDPQSLNQLQQAQLAGVEASTALTKEKTLASKAERSQPPVGAVDPVAANLNTAISNVSPKIGQQGIAAFNLAGGGKEGQKALEKVLEKATEQEQRLAAPELLKARFPQATQEEMQQLQSVLSTAKNTESGFKEAAKLRVDQRKLQDLEKVKLKAADLLKKILDNDEWNDVVGSMESGFFGGWGDNEVTAISDIEQVRDMLTVDKLKIMSGVLTDKDIQLLTNLAAGALNRNRTEDRFKSGVEELYVGLTGMNMDGSTPENSNASKINDLVSKYAN